MMKMHTLYLSYLHTLTVSMKGKFIYMVYQYNVFL